MHKYKSKNYTTNKDERLKKGIGRAYSNWYLTSRLYFQKLKYKNTKMQKLHTKVKVINITNTERLGKGNRLCILKLASFVKSYKKNTLKDLARE